jgi:pimeloyl-ACP methyl ester carboxylesterase
MKPKLSLITFIILILTLLAACGGSPKKTATPLPTPTPQPTPTETPWPESPMKFLKVGDYTFVLECHGEGEPTIILENTVGKVSWTSTYSFQSISRTCTYTHAGMNGIDKITVVRTVGDQVQDLHSLLIQAGIPGPYVLVGHKTAGFNIVLYASLYPDQVAGLVCVDCYTPQLYENQMKALGEKYNDTWDASNDLRYGFNWSIEMFRANNLERVDIIASQAQFQQVTGLGDIPFIVLVAGDPEDIPEAYYTFGPEDIQKAYVTYGLDQIHYTQSEAFSKLSSRGRVEDFPDTDGLKLLQSDHVTKAIQEIVDETRK